MKIRAYFDNGVVRELTWPDPLPSELRFPVLGNFLNILNIKTPEIDKADSMYKSTYLRGIVDGIGIYIEEKYDINN